MGMPSKNKTARRASARAALAALCLVPSGAARAAITHSWTAADYATSGLTARWDAMENAGAGVHDPTTTTWRDLVGNNDITIVQDIDSVGVWTNGTAFYMNTLVGTDKKCLAIGRNGAQTYKTIEIVCKKAASDGRFLFCGGINTRLVIFDYSSGGVRFDKPRVYFDGNTTTRYTDVDNDGEPVSLVALYSDANAVTNIYRNGEMHDDGSHKNTWSTSGGAMKLGGRHTSDDNNPSQGWEGEVYTIRLYNRSLTAEEIAANYETDQARFFSNVVVVATSVSGAEGNEASGAYEIDAEGYTFTSPRIRQVGGTTCFCTGYTLETWDGAAWSAPATNATLSCTLSDPSTRQRLTWLWEALPATSGDGLAGNFGSGDYAGAGGNGLIAHWDAINNAGTGTHDPNATVWKDLAGSNDLVLTNNLSEWRRGSAFYMDTITSSMAAAIGSQAAGAYKTIEVVYLNATREGRIMFYGGDVSRYVVFDYKKITADVTNYFDRPYSHVYFDGSPKTVRDDSHPDGTMTPYLNVKSYEPTSLVATYDDDDYVTSSLYVDGERTHYDGTMFNTWGARGGVAVSLGERNATNAVAAGSNSGWAGEIYSIRLYDRVLTAAEIARNRIIDEARFFGKLPATNVVVASSVRGIGVAEGNYTLPAGGTTFTAPATATTANGDTYSCTGYTLETWDGSAWGAPVANAATSVTLTDTSAKVRLTWQWSHTAGPGFDETFNDYVTDGLILHLDGVRNAGPEPSHDGAAVAWTDLATRNGAANFTSGAEGGGWRDDGYWFDGTGAASYAVVNGMRTLDGPFTVQSVTDFDKYFSARNIDTAWPTIVGSTYTNDWFLFYCNHDSVNIPQARFKVQNVASGFKLEGWGGEYLTGLVTNEWVALFDGETPSTTNPTNDFFPGTQIFTIGGSEGADLGYESHKFNGEIKSIRIYGRTLSNEELAQNRKIDEARFFRRAPSANAGVLIVDSDVEGLAGNLPCGAYKPIGGYAFTSPSCGTSGGVDYKLDGYSIETWDGSAWGAPVTNTGAAYEADVASASKRLVWLWSVSNRLTKIGFDVGDYVQDGLYLHFDGIRNAGANANHDSAATTWVNLGSGGTSLNATFPDYTGTHDISWAADGVKFNDGVWPSKFAQIGGHPEFNCYVTIEAVVEGTWPKTQNPIAYEAIFGATNDYLNVYYYHGGSQLGFKIFNNTAPAEGGPARTSDSYIAPGGRQYLGEWEGKYATAIWCARKYQLFQTATPDENSWTGTWHYNLDCFTNDTPFYIGGVYNADNSADVNQRRFKGKIQCLRVYNRALTDEELRWNRIVDEARFKNNPPTGTNVVVATRFSLKNGYSDGETLAETVGSYRVEGAHGFSATEVKTKSGTFLKPATGYFLERLVDGEWTDRAWHDGTEYLYDAAAEAGVVYRIIWGDSFRDGLIVIFRAN